jgi:hypothetical protein
MGNNRGSQYMTVLIVQIIAEQLKTDETKKNE